jgi:hypothetical protein
MKHEVAKKMVFHDVLESNLGNNGINGILVSILFGDNPNKRHYQYVGVCQEYDAVDGELKVAFFRLTGENGQLFRLMEEDISYVEFDDVISILPNPKLVMKGNRIYYRFPFPIDVFEKA